MTATTAVKNVLDDPPPFHKKLLDYGERPYWSADGSRIAFIDHSYGDVCEIDLASGKVRNLTQGLGQHHAFLRVLYLSNGDYLLIGPKQKTDPFVSRRVESELWVMDKNALRPPKPLGVRLSDGCAVSTLTPKIAYAVSGWNDPSLPTRDTLDSHVSDIVYGDNGPEIGMDRRFYRTHAGVRPEPQDFRFDDDEVIFAEYYDKKIYPLPHARCIVKGVRLSNGEFTTYMDEPMVHNECEGIFPDHEHMCLESSCDTQWPYHPSRDLWKMKLDGSQRRTRMTAMPMDHSWKATNSNVSPDGRWLAFMVALRGDESGFGRGLGLLDLEAWGRSEQAQQWETPADRGPELARGYVEHSP